MCSCVLHWDHHPNHLYFHEKRHYIHRRADHSDADLILLCDLFHWYPCGWGGGPPDLLPPRQGTIFHEGKRIQGKNILNIGNQAGIKIAWIFGWKLIIYSYIIHLLCSMLVMLLAAPKRKGNCQQLFKTLSMNFWQFILYNYLASNKYHSYCESC